jgi:diguanylate cyclase (GGDEF)-like protein/PAS domain S-box-containing protein
MNERAASTVLVVDDAPENVTLLARILKISGYSVEAAEDGATALEKANTCQPDLILLDINMPGMDGFETSARLKADERTRDIPIIFISALDNIEDKTRAFRAGGMDYILKPFDYEEVQARIEAHLAIRRLRLELEQANKELARRVEELTHSQALLAERERRLTAFVAALPNLSFILDEEGHYLEVMSSEAGPFNLGSAEVLGHSVEEILPPKEGARMVDAIQETLEKGSIQILEYKVPVMTGAEHWFEGRLAPMERDGKGHGKVVLMASEITERVHLYQEIQRLADRDSLTGCYNRRCFMNRASEEILRALRYKNPLSLMMVDIDHFKEFNDTYGHQVGDKLLCRMVSLCQRQLRAQDVLGRYGGDEFVVLMPETDREGAMIAAERLRSKVERLKIHTSAGNLSITVSMGIGNLERGFDSSKTLDGLVKSADTALYAAKAAGRNCVRTS